MLFLVIVGFVAALVVVLAFSFVAFINAAFGDGANRADIFRRLWQPPPVHGAGLRSWAAKTFGVVIAFSVLASVSNERGRRAVCHSFGQPFESSRFLLTGLVLAARQTFVRSHRQPHTRSFRRRRDRCPSISYTIIGAGLPPILR